MLYVLDDRWSEQLVVYPRTNKQNQKKKRKVEPATSQVGALIGCYLCLRHGFVESFILIGQLLHPMVCNF